MKLWQGGIIWKWSSPTTPLETERLRLGSSPHQRAPSEGPHHGISIRLVLTQNVCNLQVELRILVSYVRCQHPFICLFKFYQLVKWATHDWTNWLIPSFPNLANFPLVSDPNQFRWFLVPQGGHATSCSWIQVCLYFEPCLVAPTASWRNFVTWLQGRHAYWQRYTLKIKDQM